MTALTLFAFAALGSLAGAVHFWALALQVRALAIRAGLAAVLVPLLRFAVSIAVFVFAARHGAGALLAAAAGFLAARHIALRLQARRA